jgi:hypothetical protein
MQDYVTFSQMLRPKRVKQNVTKSYRPPLSHNPQGQPQRSAFLFVPSVGFSLQDSSLLILAKGMSVSFFLKPYFNRGSSIAESLLAAHRFVKHSVASRSLFVCRSKTEINANGCRLIKVFQK